MSRERVRHLIAEAEAAGATPDEAVAKAAFHYCADLIEADIIAAGTASTEQQGEQP